MNVLASASAPWGGSSSPFQRKLTPAALPTLTISSRVAWKLVAAGAIRVSCVSGCPSEVTEIQEFSLARTTRVSFLADSSDVFAGVVAKERMVTSPFFSTLTELGSLSGVVAGAGAGARFGASVLVVVGAASFVGGVTVAGVARTTETGVVTGGGAGVTDCVV
jgi:hypothetical protein